jgi:hypothetical protein
MSISSELVSHSRPKLAGLHLYSKSVISIFQIVGNLIFSFFLFCLCRQDLKSREVSKKSFYFTVLIGLFFFCLFGNLQLIGIVVSICFCCCLYVIKASHAADCILLFFVLSIAATGGIYSFLFATIVFIASAAALPLLDLSNSEKELPMMIPVAFSSLVNLFSAVV